MAAEKKKPQGIEVKVAESLQEDINEGIVRVSSEVMNELKIVSGDYVEISGKNSLVLKAMRSLESEIYSIRLDGTTRSDLTTSLGEKVFISKAEGLKEAKSITLSPLQELRLSKESNAYFHSKLLSHPLKQKQTLVIIASSKKLGYIVSKTMPKGAVYVTPSTKIDLAEEVYSGDSGKPGIYYEDIGG
ncbi:hypothetical protein HN532_02370, partial [archaeon]|nr:hypothetical protein [archaeon]